MPRIKTLVLILAGGAGGRLELLTHTRAKPAVPFAGTHRLIDFPLSNCHNSRIDDVWVSQQFNPVSLSDHLANGRPWDLDRTSGGLLRAAPAAGQRRPDGLPGGHGRRAVAQRPTDPRVRPRGARRAQRGRRLHARLLRAGRGALRGRQGRDDGHHRGRPRGRGPLRRRPGSRAARSATTPTSPTSRRATSSATRCSCSRPSRCWRCSTSWRASAGDDELEDLGHELLPRLVDARRGPRAPLRRLLARRRHDRRLPGCHMELARRRAADRPRRSRLADPHPRHREPRVGAGAAPAPRSRRR